MGDLNFPIVDWVSHCVKDWYGMAFVECIQENFLNQHFVGPMREDTTPNLLFWTIDRNCITDQQIEVVNWGMANFGGIRSELEEAHCNSLFLSKGMVGNGRLPK